MIQQLVEESEKTLLGALLSPDISDENFDYILSKLTPKCFFAKPMSELFETIRDLYQQQHAIDTASILEAMKTGELEQRKALVVECLGYYMTPVTIPHHVTQVFSAYRLRLLKKDLQNLLEEIDFGTEVSKVLECFQKVVQVQDELTKIQDCSTSMDMVDSIIEYLNHLFSLKKEAYKTGISRLDYLLGGLQPKSYNVLSGRSGMGKSDFAIYLATCMAKEGIPVLYLSMEMPRVQIMERIVSRVAKINSVKLRDKNLNKEENDSIQIILDTLGKMSLVLDEQQNLTTYDVANKIRQHRPQVVFMDHIGLMAQDEQKKHWESLQQTSKVLKQIAMKENIAFVVLVQQKREVEYRKESVSVLGDLKGSDNIGNDADTVMFIRAEKSEQLLLGDEFLNASLQIVKNRHGGTGTVKFNWYPQYHKYILQEQR